jgi:type IV fimbrial biogenesis protein FimT
MFISDNRSCAGFTVIEVLTAMSLVAILAAIGMPAFTRTLPSLRLTDAARQVATELQHVRMRAIARGIPQQITFSTGSYVVQQCNGSCTNESGNIALPQGITATVATPRFEPRGTVTTATAITLSNGSAQKFVCVTTIGRVNIKDSACS